MGRDLAEANTWAMDLWKFAENAAGERLREIYWDGGEETARTRWLQPALAVVELNLYRACADFLEPAFAAGHSAGELMALAAARVFSFEKAVELAALRGRLMDEAGGGAMTALVKVDEAKAEDIVAKAKEATGKELVLANRNTPAQFVISGHPEAVEAASGLAKELKARAIPLAVSGAFHSPLMEEAAKEFRSILDKTDFRDPVFPVVMNATASPASQADEARTGLRAQMTAGVLWQASVEAMHGQGARRFLEFGPKAVLAKMLPAILGKDADFESVTIASAEDAASLTGGEG